MGTGEDWVGKLRKSIRRTQTRVMGRAQNSNTRDGSLLTHKQMQ